MNLSAPTLLDFLTDRRRKTLACDIRFSDHPGAGKIPPNMQTLFFIFWQRKNGGPIHHGTTGFASAKQALDVCKTASNDYPTLLHWVEEIAVAIGAEPESAV